jgi:hypothetical protein
LINEYLAKMNLLMYVCMQMYSLYLAIKSDFNALSQWQHL